MTLGKKAYWLAGAAAIAMTGMTSANAAVNSNSDMGATTVAAQPTGNVQLAQADMPRSTSTSMGDLENRIRALEDQQDRIQSDRTRLSTLEQSYGSAAWTFDNGRPVFSSGDGRFTMAVRLRFQTDFAGFSQDQSQTHGAGFAGPTDLSTGVAMRRAYFGVEGKVYNDFAYEFRLNAGGSDGGSAGAAGVPTGGEGDPLLNKALISYTGIANTHISAGVLEPAFMFEGTTSSASLMFMERPEIDNIAADSFGAGDSRRGAEVGWAKSDALWVGDNLAATFFFTGGKTGSSANHGSNVTIPGAGDENTQILGRVSQRLWTNGLSNIQVGFSGAEVLNSGSNGNPNGGAQQIRFRDRPQIRVDGSRLIDTGAINAKTANMFAVDLGGNLDNFFLGGEYAQFEVDRQCSGLPAAACPTSTNVVDHPHFSGWYLEGSWIITGETKAYSPSGINNEIGGFNAPVASRPFSLSGDSWGAWELVARYSDTNLNWRKAQLATTTQLAGINGGDERVLALGLNWYLNRNVRMMLQDNIIKVKRGTAALPGRDSQDVNVLAVRLQFAN